MSLHGVGHALAAMVSLAQAAVPGQILRADGIGPVHLGMSQAEAEKALGAKLEPMGEPFDESCWQTGRADGRDGDISYMIAYDRITRIDVWQSDTGPRSAITTSMGIGIGSTEDQVKKAYGAGLKIEPHPYNEQTGHYMTVLAADGKSGLLFETDHAKVTTFRIGYEPSLSVIEGCI